MCPLHVPSLGDVLQVPRESKPRPAMIQIGAWALPTWYSSPYPAEYACLERVYLCEYCLQYFPTVDTLVRHMVSSGVALCARMFQSAPIIQLLRNTGPCPG